MVNNDAGGNDPEGNNGTANLKATNGEIPIIHNSRP
jgi:hypothetical protein